MILLNEDDDDLSISHEVEPFEGVADDLTYSLVPSPPIVYSGKTCEDSVVFLKLVTTKKKKVATITEVSKKVTRGKGGNLKLVTCLAKKKGQKGSSKEVLKLLANNPTKSIDNHRKRIKK